MNAVYCPILCGDNPDVNQGIVYPLRVPHFCQHHELVCDNNLTEHNVFIQDEKTKVKLLLLLTQFNQFTSNPRSALP